MSVLVLAECANGKLKKNAFEAAAFASGLAAQTGANLVAVVLGSASADDLASLGKAGVARVLHASDSRLDRMTSTSYTKALQSAADAAGASIIVLSHSSVGKTIAPRIAVRRNMTLVPGVSALPENGTFRKSMFSGKAWGDLKPEGDQLVITVNPNTTSFTLGDGVATVESLAVELSDSDFDYKVKEVVNESAGMTPLPEAELVVSAGRGMKGPENWGIIEELAGELGATTACSRPVADIGWRPHHEHVGQTGIAIKPNLYIAIGISGAIQHLAGVNQSKCIVVINKDPEAPFFKAADYGIVGDAFEVVPKLTEAVRKLKNS